MQADEAAPNNCHALQKVSLITCRFINALGQGWVSDAIRCIEYCNAKEAHVISNSWGGVAFSDCLQVCDNSILPCEKIVCLA